MIDYWKNEIIILFETVEVTIRQVKLNSTVQVVKTSPSSPQPTQLTNTYNTRIYTTINTCPVKSREGENRYLAQLTVNAVYFMNTAVHVVTHTDCNQ